MHTVILLLEKAACKAPSLASKCYHNGSDFGCLASHCCHQCRPLLFRSVPAEPRLASGLKASPNGQQGCPSCASWQPSAMHGSFSPTEGVGNVLRIRLPSRSNAPPSGGDKQEHRVCSSCKSVRVHSHPIQVGQPSVYRRNNFGETRSWFGTRKSDATESGE